MAKQIPTKNQFGAFGGVFTPAILTILGVIMFMRANFVVGQAGILGAVIILVIAKSITTSTSFSIAAISTNLHVRGGGSYFLISRVLGPEFGGSIGIGLFLALALSVPFYILGFTEALTSTFPELAPHFQNITLATALVMFGITFYGAGLAIKTQYLIMTFLFLSIIAFMGGAMTHFSPARFQDNLMPGYTLIEATQSAGGSFSFWIIFAIYFPAVTGIDAGVNMSGDLKDPGASIPRGTFSAVAVGFLVYFFQILICGGAWERQDLISRPFELLKDNALFGLTWLVVAGVIAATLSSSMGSFLGAPRVLQAVSRDRILGFLSYFAKGSIRGDEPRRALTLTLLITLAVLFWAGNESGGTALNAVAAVITMFFLYSYGMINLAAFIEDFGQNPSFRPRFSLFHWTIALIGCIGCIVVSFLINWQAAATTCLIIAAFLWYIKSRHLQAKFGDARRGFVYNSVRKNLLRLDHMADDPTNWRPTVLAFSGSPTMREILVSYAVWIAAKRGLVYLASVLTGDFEERARYRPTMIRQLRKFCRDHQIEAFPAVVTAESIEQGFSMLLQATSAGPIHPNIALIGWSHQYDHIHPYLRQIRTAQSLGMSILLLSAKTMPLPEIGKRIDIWWRGRKNGDLMMLIAYLLTENWQWEHSEIRLLRIIETESGRGSSLKDLKNLIDQSRIEAEPVVLVTSQAIEEVLVEHSADADCVLMGFELPETGNEKKWHGFYQRLIHRLPTVLLVNNPEEENLLV